MSGPDDCKINKELLNTEEQILQQKAEIIIDKKTLVSDRGFWLINDKNTIEHSFDEVLAKSIYEYINKKNCSTLLDLGCGLGHYCDYFFKHGIYAQGYDGNPYTLELTNGKYGVLDLSNVINLNKKYDCVLSLEVGEHIPKQYENIFIENIINHSSKYIILSWAVEGQDGLGHVNCQNNDYIKKIMFKYGFISCEKTQNIFRKNVSMYWFKNTVMIFKKYKYSTDGNLS